MSKRTVKILVTVFFVVLYVMALSGRYIERRNMLTPTSLSGVAPDFSWKDKEGKEHHVNELKGKIVILHFWAAWCEPCRAEFPDLLTQAAKLGKNVVVLAISNDADPQKAQAFLRKEERATGTQMPDNLIPVFDSDGGITYGLFQALAFPETIFVDQALHLRRKVPGRMDWSGEDMRKYLEQLKP